jgi:uncharacterized membrane protein YgcG
MKHVLLRLAVTSALFATGCRDLVVKVNKDAKNADLKAAVDEKSLDSFSLANAEDFLKQVDGIKNLAADLLIKQLAKHDYVGEFRKSVRNYRKFLISKASQNVTLTDSFYADSSKKCRDLKLSLNMDDENEMFGLILQTALLAKLSEANIGKINPGLTQEIQAIVEAIKLELKLGVEGSSTVEEIDGKTVTKGNLKLWLLPIEGEEIDAATKQADVDQVLTMSFERVLGESSTGTFTANITVPFRNQNALESAYGKFDIKREKDGDSLYKHTATMKAGTDLATPNYSRKLVVEQVKDESLKFKFTDTLNAGLAGEAATTTLINTKDRTQCKIAGGVIPPRGDDGDDDDGKDDGKDDGDGSGGGGGGGSGGGGSGGGGNKPTQNSPTQNGKTNKPTQNK